MDGPGARTTASTNVHSSSDPGTITSSSSCVESPPQSELPAATAIALQTPAVVLLQEEVDKLKNERSEMKHRHMLQAQAAVHVAEIHQTFYALTADKERLTRELETTAQTLTDAQTRLELTEQTLASTQVQMEENKEKLRLIEIEQAEMQNVSKMELQESRDRYKERVDHLVDRLGPLSASLEQMTDNQEDQETCFTAQESCAMSGMKLRHDKLQATLTLEDQTLTIVSAQAKTRQDTFERQQMELVIMASEIAYMTLSDKAGSECDGANKCRLGMECSVTQRTKCGILL